MDMDSAAVSRQCQCRGTETAAQREGQNDNPALRPGANRPCRGFTVSAAHWFAGPHDDMP